jgi:hypothetical protein
LYAADGTLQRVVRWLVVLVFVAHQNVINVKSSEGSVGGIGNVSILALIRGSFASSGPTWQCKVVEVVAALSCGHDAGAGAKWASAAFATACDDALDVVPPRR